MSYRIATFIIRYWMSLTMLIVGWLWAASNASFLILLGIGIGIDIYRVSTTPTLLASPDELLNAYREIGDHEVTVGNLKVKSPLSHTIGLGWMLSFVLVAVFLIVLENVVPTTVRPSVNIIYQFVGELFSPFIEPARRYNDILSSTGFADRAGIVSAALAIWFLMFLTFLSVHSRLDMHLILFQVRFNVKHAQGDQAYFERNHSGWTYIFRFIFFYSFFILILVIFYALNPAKSGLYSVQYFPLEDHDWPLIQMSAMFLGAYSLNLVSLVLLSIARLRGCPGWKNLVREFHRQGDKN